MNVANKSLCEELYKLSKGWGSDLEYFYHPDNDSVITPKTSYETQTAIIPAYDLGFMLHKSPMAIVPAGDKWAAYHGVSAPLGRPIHSNILVVSDDTPENAAARCCIELIKQGVLAPSSKEVV